MDESFRGACSKQMHIPVVYKHNFTHIAKSRATVVPKWSKRKPLGSVKKLFIKEVMVKISENCSSCALQSVGNAEKDINKKTAVYLDA